MLKYFKDSTKIILSYSGDQTGSQWVYSEISDKGSVTLRRVFTVSEDELISEQDVENEDASVEFKIADKVGSYYRFSKSIMSLRHDLFIHEDWELNNKTFFAERNISVFSKIDAISDEPIYLGGKNENSIPEEVFSELLKNFPNSYELTKYAHARISAVISSYLKVKEDYEENYKST